MLPLTRKYFVKFHLGIVRGGVWGVERHHNVSEGRGRRGRGVGGGGAPAGSYPAPRLLLGGGGGGDEQVLQVASHLYWPENTENNIESSTMWTYLKSK